jgi:2-octaprenyl-6-methoxyphenol hydroxylase
MQATPACNRSEAAVIGGGPAGLVAALALSASGSEVVIAAPPADALRPDTRTTALLPDSVELLRNLGVWQLCQHHGAPLLGVRIIDDRGGLLRAPEVLFPAQDLGLPSLGANIANAALNAALQTAAGAAPRLTRLATARVTKVAPGERSVVLETAEGGILGALLAVGADGRNSIARAAADIPVETWDYGQSAVATSFVHARPHDGITTELHRRAGPLTTVPLPGNASSLVWVETPAEARRLADLDDGAFLQELAQRLLGLLGALSDLGPRSLYPLAGLGAASMGRNRIALVGEAAHVIPPIGAQGLNLGLRDAAELAQCVAAARAGQRDIGGRETLDAYHRARAGDVLTRTLSVDLLNRSLLTDFLPAQALRGLGLHALANIAPLRRLAMRAGLAGAGPRPPLMRPRAPS